MTTRSLPSETPRTEAIDAARSEAWNVLRLLAEWGGDGAPMHEEGRRIVRTARRHARECKSGCIGRLHAALDVIDPTGQSFPVAIATAWDARKANA